MDATSPRSSGEEDPGIDGRAEPCAEDRPALRPGSPTRPGATRPAHSEWQARDYSGAVRRGASKLGVGCLAPPRPVRSPADQGDTSRAPQGTPQSEDL